MHILALIKLKTVFLYLDSSKKILHFEITCSDYSKEEFITIMEYFKNFWILANENHIKYNMIIDVCNIGVYPLSIFENIKNTLIQLEPLFLDCLHSSCLITDSNLAITILKPLFSIYKSNRPFTFVSTYDEALLFFNKSENKLSEKILN